MRVALGNVCVGGGRGLQQHGHVDGRRADTHQHGMQVECMHSEAVTGRMGWCLRMVFAHAQPDRHVVI